MTSSTPLYNCCSPTFYSCFDPSAPQQSNLDTCHTDSHMHAPNICTAGVFGRRYLHELPACVYTCRSQHPLYELLRSANPPLRWTVGSALFLASFAAIMGPMNYVYHLFSAPRLPFTAAYFGSIAMTLVFAIKVCQTPTSRKDEKERREKGPGYVYANISKVHSTILTLLASLVQLAALIWYLVSYFPMGSTGLRLATSFGARQATAWLSG